jgi:putative ABC transport system permease protein
MSRRDRMMGELDQDIREHIERETQDNIERGMPPNEAHFAAVRKFGNVTRVQEDTRKVWSFVWLEQFLQDLRYGIRSLARSPGFAVVAIITMALGIGANTAIFSVVNAVLLMPLPYHDPGQLVSVFTQKLQDGIPFDGISYLNMEDLRRQNTVFAELAGNTQHELTLIGQGEPTVVSTAGVTPELFSLLGTAPLAGRTFFSEDGKPGAAPVVILNENLWRSRFGADPGILGRSINLDKRAFRVVGIMPAQFRSPILSNKQDIWIPVSQDSLFGNWLGRRGGHWMGVIGRLKPGVSIAQAQAQMDTVSARLAHEFPNDNAGWRLRVQPLKGVMVGDLKTELLVLLGAVGLVLLIACANIANLLLARATSRGKEMAVRIALGAGRARIVRQLLTESVVLGLLGGVAGIALAFWGVRGLATLLPPGLPQMHAIRIDGGVLAFALLLSLAAGIVFGLAPALFGAGPNVQTNLKEGEGQTGESGWRRRARSILVIGEIALAMVLLVAAGLLMRSFAALVSVSPGFHTEHVLKADIQLPRFQYSTPEQWAAFANTLMTRIHNEPGLGDSAIGVPLPLDEGFVNLAFEIGGGPTTPGTAQTADYTAISPDYFHVMGIPLLQGRAFSDQDSMSAPRVTVISAAMARRHFPNEDALGRRLTFGFPPDPPVTREIVGVVGDVRDVSLSEQPGPMMYVPFAQSPFWGGQLVVKSTLSTSSVVAAIRQDVHAVDKDLPVTDVQTLPEMIGVSVAQTRFRTLLLGLFAAIALALAAAGIFGVISYSVACRTREIGIRMALGAKSAGVMRLILGESTRLVLLGLMIGIPAALGLGHFLASLLFGVRAADPLTFAGVAVLLAVVALAASYVPTRRAMHVDPMVALRHE